MNRASSFALFLRLVAPLASACSLVACGDDPVGIVPGGIDPDGGPGISGPSIVKQPSSSSFSAGSTATFEVVAGGPGPLDYQWLRGGAVIAGATSAKLTLPNVAMTDDKTTLSVVVKNVAGSVKSADAILSVTTPVIADSPYPTLCTGPKSSGFCWVTPVSGTKLAFADAKNGVLANGALIFRTTDGGVRWFLAQVNGGTDLASIEDVRFLSPSLGVAVGQTRTSGAVSLRSTDGGATWNTVTSGITGSLLGVGFSGTKVGAEVGAGGRIAYTTDGGASWLPAVSPAIGVLTSVAFASDTIGIAVGTFGTVLRTVDSGATWANVDSGSTTATFDSVKFVSATKAFIVGESMLRSDDAGLTWTPVAGVGALDDVAFSDAMHGVATGANGKSVQTVDGGTTWTKLTGALTNLHAVAFADASTVVVLGQAIQRSTDGGKTWGVTSPTVDITPPPINGIRYADATTAVAVGGSGSFGALISRSTDGGGTWQGVQSPTSDVLVGVDFATPKIGAAVGAGVVLRTVDGGVTWTVASTDPSRRFYAVRFANDKLGVAIGRQGLVLRTEDAGATWTPIAAALGSNALTAVAFGSASVGVIGDDSGNMFHTTDGGLTWPQTETGVPGSGSNGIDFANATTVVATGAGGVIRRSTNGGGSWTTLAVADASLPGSTAIRFVSPTLGYIVGEAGVIKRSTDGGATWSEPFPHLIAPFSSIDFSGPSNGLIGGGLSNILRTTTAGQ